ncbi:hypothetical protein HMPREF3156_02363 [Neisseria sp. HMSC06F02]|nr:hypothetical protein HMPREF3156_02363 [Neisseria sp. HMSC06F02]
MIYHFSGIKQTVVDIKKTAAAVWRVKYAFSSVRASENVFVV